MGTHAAGPRSKSRRHGLESARLGPPDRKNSPRSAASRRSRLHKTAEYGPPVDDEYLYNVVDVLDEVAKETGKTIPQIALNWLLQRPTVANVIIGARNEEQLRAKPRRSRMESDRRANRQLDAASDRTPTYPYWHQRQFERNPKPV